MLTIDSRDVAKMLGKEHYDLLKEIEGRKDSKNVGVIPALEKGSFHVSNYFIESSYKSGTREYKCYLVTKMGCELIANKRQGEKGILFTAGYVEKFNNMEQRIKVPVLKSNSKAGGLNGLLKTLNGVMKEEKIIAYKRAEVLKDVAVQCGIIIPDDFIKKPAFVQAVLKDIRQRGIENIVNLGDSLYGPLDPCNTAEILMNEKIISILGNQDRNIVESLDRIDVHPTMKYVIERFNIHSVKWIKSLSKTLIFLDDFFLCHGTPNDY